MRLGIDLGGTKTEILALDETGQMLLRRRILTERNYAGQIAAITALVHQTECDLRRTGSLGLAIPGTISRRTSLVKNANATWLNDKPFARDLEQALGRPVRIANDANCFALSEAVDGAGAGYDAVFGVILGTGVGGGVVIDGHALEGANSIAGEWGHNPLPHMSASEAAEIPQCYCGRTGCIEQWLSGPGLAADFVRHLPEDIGPECAGWDATTIAASDYPAAVAALERWLDRLARSLATVVNLLDPDIMVLGGGLSNITQFRDRLPSLVEAYAFRMEEAPRIVAGFHGDSSGVRGAAWLWPQGTAARAHRWETSAESEGTQ